MKCHLSLLGGIAIPKSHRHRVNLNLNPIVGCREKNHYEVLSVPRGASAQDIKKAFRLLARKYHPDVTKDPRGPDAFITIRRAYEVLSNEATRAHYDRALQLELISHTRFTPHDLKQNIHYHHRYHNFHFHQHHDDDDDDDDDDEGQDHHQLRTPFFQLLQSTFLSLFLLQTFGPPLSLTFTALLAFLDPNLDTGYKIGYLITWILGGRAGVLLGLCLSFASWVCGKSSSSVVAVVVVAMWVGTNLARYAPLPQGAILTLLYMSIKLQADLN